MVSEECHTLAISSLQIYPVQYHVVLDAIPSMIESVVKSALTDIVRSILDNGTSTDAAWKKYAQHISCIIIADVLRTIVATSFLSYFKSIVTYFFVAFPIYRERYFYLRVTLGQGDGLCEWNSGYFSIQLDTLDKAVILEDLH